METRKYWRVFDPLRDASISAAVWSATRLVLMIVGANQPETATFKIRECKTQIPVYVWERYRRMVEGRYERRWMARYGHTLPEMKAWLKTV